MSKSVELIWYGEDAPPYDHGPQHPLRPARVELTRQLIHACGLLDGQAVVETLGRSASDPELAAVHTPAYIDAVRRAGRGERGPWGRFGFGPGDNPVFSGMHEAAARGAGCSIVAAEAVASGRAEHAFNPAGGLHHAMADRASGFCVYDDPALAIAWLLDHGSERVAYVDVDVHHGDGPQAIFYEDPRVLTISLHQDGRTLFPGTGAVEEMGAAEAVGTKVNVPLAPGTGDSGWLAAFEEIVPPLVEVFRPDVLVTQLGCDTHCLDPLAGLMLTTAAYRRAAAVLHQLAHGYAGGRWVALGGGGYQWAEVVPRAWTIYFAEMAGVVLSEALPAGWLGRAEEVAGRRLPARLYDPPMPDAGGSQIPAPAVLAVKREIFPRHWLA